MRSTVPFALAAAVLLPLAAPAAIAQSQPEGWEYTIAPYLMAGSLDGSLGIGPIEVDVDVPFETIIENLDMAAMVQFDMRNERWVVGANLVHVDIEGTDDVARGEGTVNIEETLLEVSGGYRVSRAVTLLAGLRWVDLGTSLSYSGPVVDGSVDASKSWLDTFVGVQVTAPLGERWWFTVHGDVGAASIGSDLAWQAYANVGFRASKLISIIAGYRTIAMNYEDGSGRELFIYDVTMSGPQVGIGFHF